MDLIRRSFSLLLPQDCVLCRAESGARLLCPSCEDALPRLQPPCCPRCALPTPAVEICGRCLSRPPNYDFAAAAFHYAFPIDRLIHSFKYGRRLPIGSHVGGALASLTANPETDLIVPLPLHPLRLRERGFNQAVELARALSEAWRTPVDCRSCRRIRQTRAQADLPWAEREANVRGAFDCSADFSGKRVLLVDDVMTTGASLNEVARILKLHGAAEVTVRVVARALPPR